MEKFDKEYYQELAKTIRMISELYKDQVKKNEIDETIELYKKIGNCTIVECYQKTLAPIVEDTKNNVIKSIEEKIIEIENLKNHNRNTIYDYLLVLKQEEAYLDQIKQLKEQLETIKKFDIDYIIMYLINSKLEDDISQVDKDKKNIIDEAKYMLRKIKYNDEPLVNEDGKPNYLLIKELEDDINSTEVLRIRKEVLKNMSNDKSYKNILEIENSLEIVSYKLIYNHFKKLYGHETEKAIKKINKKFRYRKFKKNIKSIGNGKYIIDVKQIKARLKNKRNNSLNEILELMIYYKDVMNFIKSTLEKDGIIIEKKLKCYNCFEEMFSKEEIHVIKEHIINQYGMGIIEDDIKITQEKISILIRKMIVEKLNDININREIEIPLAKMLDMDITINGEKNIAVVANLIFSEIKWVKIVNYLYSLNFLNRDLAQFMLQNILGGEEGYSKDLKDTQNKQYKLYNVPKKIGEISEQKGEKTFKKLPYRKG